MVGIIMCHSHSHSPTGVDHTIKLYSKQCLIKKILALLKTY